MPSPIPTDLPTIMQTVETQLSTYVTVTGNPVVGDISNIYWVFPGDEPVPGTTGQRDVLFALHGDKTENFQGDGRFALTLSGCDVYLRSTLASDRRATYKQWMIDNRGLVNGLLDALNGFFPVDADQNCLTIEGFVPDENSAPARNRTTLTWGEVVASYSFHYLINIAQIPLPEVSS